MIEGVYNYDFQPQNDWSFFFEDNTDIIFNIKDMTLPFFQNFEVLNKESGEKYISKVNHITEFTMTVQETRNFDTYQYFKNWLDLTYDTINQVFKLNPPVNNAVLIFHANFTPIPTKKFSLLNIRFLGFENLSLNYSDGSAMTHTLKFSVEEMLEI